MASPYDSLRKLTRRPPRSEADFEAMMAEMYAESNDRGTALVASAFLQHMLQSVIEVHFIKLSDMEFNGLFGRDGSLSSFSSQIRIGYALGVYDAAMRDSLDCIREIRNVFAHAMTPVSFETSAVTAATSRLAVHPMTDEEPKARFLAAVGRLVDILGVGMIKHPPQRRTPLTYDTFPDA